MIALKINIIEIINKIILPMFEKGKNKERYIHLRELDQPDFGNTVMDEELRLFAPNRKKEKTPTHYWCFHNL